MSELNLDNAICNLLVNRLNKYRYKKEAMVSLGIGRTKFPSLIKKYGISKTNGKYVSKIKNYEQIKSNPTT